MLRPAAHNRRAHALIDITEVRARTLPSRPGALPAQ